MLLPTEQISMYLDLILQPIVASLPSYIKDTNHALTLLSDYSFPLCSPDRFLFTLDVVSLYTSIPHTDGLVAMKHFLSKDSRKLPINTLLRLCELVLSLNSFSFNNDHYQQTSGVAMGTRMGPSFACLFMGHFEEQVRRQYTGVMPDFYRRFIDDCLGLATCSRSELQVFIDFVSNFHPSIKFTHTVSQSSITFLDLSISISPSLTQVTTSVHYKPTDSHSYLSFHSSHPLSTKTSIPFSQFLRLRRICSSDTDFQSQARLMSSFFLNRGYPPETISSALDKASSISRATALIPKEPPPTTDRPILSLTYHPHNMAVKHILFRHFHILQTDPQLKDIFPQPPLLAHKRDANLKDLLVTATVSSPTRTPPGNHPCSQAKCPCCPYINSSTLISGPQSNFTIRTSFTCLSADIIYVISCRHCQQIYVGETYRTLRERFSEHLRSVRLPHYNTPVALHFRQPPHTLADMQVAAIWHNNSSAMTKRKFMESIFIRQLGCLSPSGINIRP